MLSFVFWPRQHGPASADSQPGISWAYEKGGARLTVIDPEGVVVTLRDLSD
jgi:hypothetical protein